MYRTCFREEVVSFRVLRIRIISDLSPSNSWGGGRTSDLSSSMALTNARLSEVTERIVSVRPCRKPRVPAVSYVAVTYP